MRNTERHNYTSINWNPERGYPKVLPNKYTPRRALGPGETLGFSLVLDVQYNKYYCSSANGAGFKIALHSPNESPNIKETGVLIAPGMETKMRITPVKTETSQALRSMNRKYRRCLFYDELKLKYFAHYTQRNCEMECASETMMQHCGCMQYYMPKIYKNANVCSIADTPCFRALQYRKDPNIKLCVDNCFPSCYDYAYLLDTFALPISHNGFNISSALVGKFSENYVQQNIAVVNMYFKENSFRSYLQTEFTTASDFLASVGGLLGFLLGASVITFVEIYYFAIIRPVCSFFIRKTNAVGEKIFRRNPKIPLRTPKNNSFAFSRYGKLQRATPIYSLQRMSHIQINLNELPRQKKCIKY